MSAELDKKLKKEKQKEEEEIKLLLLGAGESGKSTIFKQFQIINKGGFSEEDRAQFSDVIRENIVQSMKHLLNHCKKAGIALDEGHEEMAELVQAGGQKGGSGMDEELAMAIKTLWTDDNGIKQAYDRRAEFQLNDSASYFFDRIDKCAKPNYTPDEQDVLRARVKTTGIVEAEFDVEGYHFRCFDVGGQRNERRKWIHCFESVTAVIFIVGVSEYDQKLYEDETQNRMLEALDLFNEICNSRWFENTSIILFLNKKDLLEEKLKKGVDMKCCFPNYTGGCDYTKALEFVKEEFHKLNQKPQTKQVYPHETCATDTENVKFVFNAVKDVILHGTLRDSGIL